MMKRNYMKPAYTNGNEDYILSVINSNEKINKKYKTFTRATGRFSVYDSVSPDYIGELKTRTFGLFSDNDPKAFHPFILKGLMLEKQKYDNLMIKSKQFNKPALYINHLQGDHIIIFNLNKINISEIKIVDMVCTDKKTLKKIVKPSYLLNYTLGELYINQLETMGIY